MNSSYQAFLKKGIDLAPLGIAASCEETLYFCTPKGARTIGWAGVDGIHFCFIRGFGEMVFAVSPMNPAPNYVHPLARDFSDFLRLLLACGDSAALEQAWQWDLPQFEAFLADNPPTPEQNMVLEQIREQTDLSPMEDPWHYLHQLQTSFDYSKIKYTQEFYDLDLNPDAPQPAPEWKVTFEGGFWGHSRERAGKELAIGKEFDWAGHHWLIPSVYLCAKGLVVDFCMQVEPSQIQAFMEKWDLTIENEGQRQFSPEEQMQLALENPLILDFCATLQVNGKKLESTHGSGTAYAPCLGPDYTAMDEALQAMEHYGLDPDYGWVLARFSYPWATKRKPTIRSLSLTMIQDPVSIPGPHLKACHPGTTATFLHEGQEHTLTVQEYETKIMDWSSMPDTGLEHPSHYAAMSYTVSPELPDGVLTLEDCREGDRPRQPPSPPGQPEAENYSTIIGIIGGVDGPEAVLFGPNQYGKLHAAYSSLHFEPVDHVEWRLVFHETQFDDLTVDLLTQ